METKISPPAFNSPEPVAPVKARRKKKARWPWVVGALALLVALMARGAMKPKPDDTKFATVSRQDIRQTVTATGAVTLQTAAEVKIGAEVSGKVKRLYVDVGDRVRAGQLIAELENAESDASLVQAKASADAAQARVSQSQASLAEQSPSTNAAIAKAQADIRAAQARYRQAVLTSNSQPATTRADIQRARASLATAKDTLNQARTSASLQIDSARSALESAQAQQEKAAADAGRSQSLLAKGYISKADFDVTQTQARVTASDVVARQRALELARETSRHDVEAAKNAVNEAEAALSTAQAGASQVGVRSAEAEAARADLEQAKQGLAAAEAGRNEITMRAAATQESSANYRQSVADYDRQSKNHEKLRIFSPIDGIVANVDTKEGETVTAGFQTPTLMTIDNLNRVQVDVPVDETDIGKLTVGQTASVTVDAFPNQPLQGRVVKIASAATDTTASGGSSQSVITYNVTVALVHPNVPLKPKMTATVNVDTGLVRNALVVPLDAVKTSKDNDVVYLPPAIGGPKGKPAPFKEATVRTGASDDKVIQVLGNTLHVGDKVVLSSSRLEEQRRMEADNG